MSQDTCTQPNCVNCGTRLTDEDVARDTRLNGWLICVACGGTFYDMYRADKEIEEHERAVESGEFVYPDTEPVEWF